MKVVYSKTVDLILQSPTPRWKYWPPPPPIRCVSLCSDLLGMVIADGKYIDLFASLSLRLWSFRGSVWATFARLFNLPILERDWFWRCSQSFKLYVIIIIIIIRVIEIAALKGQVLDDLLQSYTWFGKPPPTHTHTFRGYFKCNLAYEAF